MASLRGLVLVTMLVHIAIALVLEKRDNLGVETTAFVIGAMVLVLVYIAPWESFRRSQDAA